DPPFVYPQTIVNSNDSSPATSETINNMSTINYPTNYTLDDGQSINHASIHPSSSLTSPPGTTISNHNQSPVNLQSINSLNNNNLSNIPPSPISLASSSSLSSASLSEKYENSRSGTNRRRRRSVNPLNDDSNNFTSLSHAEFRRQIHIQSEQKRRAEIKDGFDELRKQLPITYANRKMSKALLLQKAVAHMKNMQRKENFLLDEINRLSQRCIYMNAELENEKRYYTR
ncbi:15032_t:CDS:2, partial [Entrophospora sp. SA101]